MKEPLVLWMRGRLVAVTGWVEPADRSAGIGETFFVGSIYDIEAGQPLDWTEDELPPWPSCTCGGEHIGPRDNPRFLSAAEEREIDQIYWEAERWLDAQDYCVINKARNQCSHCGACDNDDEKCWNCGDFVDGRLAKRPLDFQDELAWKQERI